MHPWSKLCIFYAFYFLHRNRRHCDTDFVTVCCCLDAVTRSNTEVEDSEVITLIGTSIYIVEYIDL